MQYLAAAGFVRVRSMAGESLRCGGEFFWSGRLAKMVAEHNVRLEPEFEKAVLEDPKRLTAIRREMLARGIHTWEL